MRGNPLARVLFANATGTLLVALYGRRHQEPPARYLQQWRPGRAQTVALTNKRVAPAFAAVASDGVILFLKMPVAPGAVEIQEEEEGKRGVGDDNAAAGHV